MPTAGVWAGRSGGGRLAAAVRSRRENLADRRRIIAERLRELQAACLGKELEA